MAVNGVIRDFLCTACGCACDDLALKVESNRVVSFEPPCPLAEAFFLANGATLDATQGPTPQLVEQAAALLSAARAPLIMGLERATVDAQRLAVAIADHLGAFIDPTDDRGLSRSHAAVQTVGAVTATLGEVAARSDLVVYWECDPAVTHPRHRERFANRAGQHVVVVDSWPSPSAALADEYLLIPTGSGFEGLWTLRALVRGIAVDADVAEQQTGNSLESWQRLAERLKAAHYPAIFYGSAPEQNVQAITELVRDLHWHTRAVALPLGAAGNAAGAAQVLTWQTGFPAAVRFARGYPQYLPGEATAARLLERREVDAALVISADPLPHLPAKAAAHLRAIPTIVVDDRETATLAAATVALRTARFGVQAPGSVYRSDGVPLPLRVATTSPLPAAAKILAALAAALAV
jgi:formylmethanofuran dehydrogenase subunit B